MMTPILILHQSINTERPDELDSLYQAQSIADTLQSLGWSVSIEAISSVSDLEQILRQYPSELIVNLVESLYGRDEFAYLVPALLEAKRRPFTGNPAFAMQLGNQKQWVNTLLMNAQIPIPRPVSIDQIRDEKCLYIIKSATEHASFGLSEQNVLCGPQAIADRYEELKQTLGGEWIIEEYIHGREFNISIIEQPNGQITVLPPAEMTFINYAADRVAIVDYAAKWDEAAFSYRHTKRVFMDPTESQINQHLWEDLQVICRQTWSLLRLRGYARIDFRVNAQNQPLVIDINPNPCLSHDAGFIAACQQFGLSFADAIQVIVQTTMVFPSTPDTL